MVVLARAQAIVIGIERRAVVVPVGEVTARALVAGSGSGPRADRPRHRHPRSPPRCRTSPGDARAPRCPRCEAVTRLMAPAAAAGPSSSGELPAIDLDPLDRAGRQVAEAHHAVRGAAERLAVEEERDLARRAHRAAKRC